MSTLFKICFVVSIISCIFAADSQEEDKKETFSIFSLPSKEMSNNIIIGNTGVNQEIARIKYIQTKAKKVACLALINNSIKNKDQQLIDLLSTDKAKKDEIVDKIVEQCMHNITNEQADKIISVENISNLNTSTAQKEYAELLKYENKDAHIKETDL